MNEQDKDKEIQRLKRTSEDVTVQISQSQFEQYNKYRSALEEIRKLIIIGVNASQCNCGSRALADDILDKINEVTDERN